MTAEDKANAFGTYKNRPHAIDLGCLQQDPTAIANLRELFSLPDEQFEAKLRLIQHDFSHEQPCIVGMARSKQQWDEDFRWEEGKPQRSFPKRIGRFRISKPLRIRRSCSVLQATDEATGQVVALKVQMIPLLSDRHHRRFQLESKLLAAIDSPHVVRFVATGEEDHYSYVAMELLQGLDLAQVIHHGGPLPLQLCCEIIAQAAIGLQALHDKGIIHRDIKPSNLFLTNDGNVKVLDLGVARFACNDGLTLSADILGTVDYMAPEQAFDTADVDATSDIYSLGCTFYFLLTGEPPFAGRTGGNILRTAVAHASEALPDVREKRPDIEQSVVDILQKMLAKEPALRFQLASEVADVVANYYPSQGELREFAEGLMVVGGNTVHESNGSDENVGCRHGQPYRAASEVTESISNAAGMPVGRLALLSGLALLVFVVIGTVATRLDDQGAEVRSVSAILPADVSRQLPRAAFRGHQVGELLLPRRVVVADVDGDDSQDIVIATNSKIGYFRNDGMQNFSLQIINHPYIVTSIATTDIDSDGDLDIAATTYGNESEPTVGNTLVVYINNGEAGFDWVLVTKTAQGAHHVEAVDLDADGDQDLLLASSRDHSFSWYENLGELEFDQHVVGEGINARCMSSGDFNNDGIKDLVCVSEADGQVAVYLGHWSAAGRLEYAAQQLARMEGACFVNVVDFDRDGDDDVLVSSKHGSQLVWYENTLATKETTKLAWIPRQLVSGLSGCQHFSVVDLDGDQDFDLVVANSNAGQVVILENDGEMNLSPKMVSSKMALAMCAAVGDIDSDGDVDIVAVAHHGKAITWFEAIEIKANPAATQSP